MINKYSFNQAIFWLNTIVFGFNLYFLSTEKSWIWVILQFIVSTICLHYFCNLSHLASHQMLSRNKKINHIFGWFSSLPVLVFSFIDFKITHQQHHIHTTNEVLDPDYRITHGSVILIPFKMIIYKDGYFLKRAFLKKKFGQLFEYLFQRVIQLGIFAYILYLSVNRINVDLAIFYIIPLLIVGILNGIFLYYYPHYQNKIEFWARKHFDHQNKFSPFFWVGFFVTWCIDLSRIAHQDHHDKISFNEPYYPEFWLWKNTFLNQKDNWRYLSGNIKNNNT
jgi:fatty acid desaturase